MEELAKILAEIADYLEVDRVKILKGDTPKSLIAKKLTCYILEEGFPHLVADFAVMAEMNINAVYAAASKMASQIKNDVQICKTANALRRKVGLRMLKKAAKPKKRAISTTKQLFGFDYTYREEMAYERACKNATEFMTDFCKGIQPLEEGFLTKRKKEKFLIQN